MNDYITICYVRVDTANNDTKILITIGRHGCESDMGEVGGRKHYCSEHRDSCFNIDDSTFPKPDDPNVTVTDMEMCFCSKDRYSSFSPPLAVIIFQLN